MFSWSRVVEYFPKIITKFPVTLEIVLLSFGIGLLLGVLLAAIQLKKSLCSGRSPQCIFPMSAVHRSSVRCL